MDKMKAVLFNLGNKPTRHKAAESPFNPLSDDGSILVHHDTHNPTRAWEVLKVKQTLKKVKPLPRNTNINPRKVRFVCISDTHNRTSNMTEAIPDGDVLLHAGDFTMVGQPKQVEEFNEFLGKMPHKYKIVIAGNHDMTFDSKMVKDKNSLQRFGLRSEDVATYLRDKQISGMSEVLTNCSHYLEDSFVELYGIKIYGSPWQPSFGDWGFNLERGEACLEKWNMIPNDVDVLMTHGPPIGHGDYCSSDQRAGCVELLHTIQHRVKPKYHVFGHIHEGYGITTDGTTKYVNASTCTLRYKPTNPPIIFDIPLPMGYTKESDEQEGGVPMENDQDSDISRSETSAGACA